MPNAWINHLRNQRKLTGLSGPSLFKSASASYQRGGSGLQVVYVALDETEEVLFTRSTMDEFELILAEPKYTFLKAIIDGPVILAEEDDEQDGVPDGTDLYLVVREMIHNHHKELLLVTPDYGAARSFRDHYMADENGPLLWRTPTIINTHVGENWSINMDRL
jgi:hypothetical protein